MDVQIKTIDDLKSEISRLKNVRHQQGQAIRQHFNSVPAAFSTVFSLFPKSQLLGGLTGSAIFNQDIIQLLSRFLLPFALNNTLFKQSNSVIKSLVRFVSTHASQFINEKSINHLWDKIKTLFASKDRKQRHLHNTLN